MGQKLNVVPFTGRVPSEVSRPPDTGMLLRRAIREVGDRNSTLYALRTRENLPRIVADFSAYFTDALPSTTESKSLISRCLDKAVAEMRKACIGGTDDDGAYQRFICGLFQHVDESLGWYVYVNRHGREIVWDPLTESLWKYWGRHQTRPQVENRIVPWDTVAQSDFRVVIASRILNRDDLTVLRGGLRAFLETGT